MRFVATVNIPGYLPMADEPAVFDSAREAWEYLIEEIERGELAWEPDDPADPEGPASRTETALELERRVESDRPGTVYGPSWLGEDRSTDLGLAYSVDYAEDDVPHVGHFSHLGGTWFCDTCNSPYCERA